MRTKFITTFIQDGRRKPKKFMHYVRIPQDLFTEMMEAGAIDPERYYIDGVAFFECSSEYVTVNFINLYNAEDFYSKATHYLIVKAMGSNPVTRGGIFDL